MATDIDHEAGVREPSLLDALIPLLFMIGLLTLSIVLFGIDAALGPLQVALLSFAALISPIQKALQLISVLPRQPKKFAGIHVGGFRPEEGFKSPAKIRAIPGSETIAL